MLIKEIQQNKENLHSPFVVLDNGERVNIAVFTLRALYGEGLGIGKEYNKEEVFNFEREQAIKELLPIVKKELSEVKTYNRLSQRAKGFYSILKNYKIALN